MQQAYRHNHSTSYWEKKKRNCFLPNSDVTLLGLRRRSPGRGVAHGKRRLYTLEHVLGVSPCVDKRVHDGRPGWI